MTIISFIPRKGRAKKSTLNQALTLETHKQKKAKNLITFLIPIGEMLT